jgi:hypothetical protein
MNIEEAKAMEGVEFDYIFEDGDTIRAYVKKFDPEIGLTCLSLETETKLGWRPSEGIEEDGTFCVVAYDLKHSPESFSYLIAALEKIKTGTYFYKEYGISFIGCPF